MSPPSIQTTKRDERHGKLYEIVHTRHTIPLAHAVPITCLWLSRQGVPHHLLPSAADRSNRPSDSLLHFELECFLILLRPFAHSDTQHTQYRPYKHPSITMYVPFQEVFAATLLGAGILKNKKGEVISDGQVLDYCRLALTTTASL